ncbi:winged helix-turn-helix domain-containing protein [Variovorax sp. dw_954]|uniref:winged helix-turn-helix domain-containing tetratricopeptide repeat protein n=1 Tax=Variovorax sp. dw_954 TaxID=2720078 RepID=UPI001BD29A8F|nr:winged helix-turn-helix domain-containing protein [Variovorax sp. dw_954]
MAQEVFVLGDFRLDPGRRLLLRNEQPIELKPKALEILCVLASARGAVVTKDALMSQVWPGLVVEENNIQVHVSALRKVLAGDSSGALHLMTVAGHGYRLLGIGLEPATVMTAVEPLRRRGPSVAVLPFAYLGDDPAQEYFAEGVVDDIITGLSRVRWLSVIARHSSFVFRGADVDLPRVAHELHADYLLHGSFRRSGDRIRVSARLTETAGGTEVWAERHERLLGDVFDLQDDIAASILGAIEPGLRRSEIERIRRKRPGDLDAYDLVLRALPHVYTLMPEGCAPAMPLLQRALDLEPGYALAHATLAWCHHVRFSRGGLDAAEREASIRHARAAVALGSDDALALAIGAFVIWFDAHDIAAAFDLFDRALLLSPSNVVALATSAVALAWSGRPALAIERARRALQLSPFDALRYLAYQALSGARFQSGDFERAEHDARLAVESCPGFSVPYAYLCAALVRVGKLDEARQTVRQMLGIDPGFCISRFRVTVGVDDAVFNGFAMAWREARMPD